MATRICRHCGSILEGVKAAEYKGNVKCSACGVESIFLTEKHAKEMSEEKRIENKQRPILLKEAERIRNNFVNIPTMSFEDRPDFAVFRAALRFGIIFPPGVTSRELQQLIDEAKLQGHKDNPYVYDMYSHEQCDEIEKLWNQKTPAHHNQIESLIGQRICSNKDLTYSDAEAITKYLIKEMFEYPCAGCGHKNSRYLIPTVHDYFSRAATAARKMPKTASDTRLKSLANP